MSRRQKMADIPVSNFQNESDSEEIDSNEFELSSRENYGVM